VGNILGFHDLVVHPATPPGAVKDVRVQVTSVARDRFAVEYSAWPAEALALPARKAARRADDLWSTTCFELFAKPAGGEVYFEFNLSPSFEWAAYGFARYRAERRQLALGHDPEISITPVGFFLSAELDLGMLGEANARLGLSAVIEETDGTKSYWALAHPPGDKPDFHDPACFALELPPATP
jgi:hypothetical protein